MDQFVESQRSVVAAKAEDLKKIAKSTKKRFEEDKERGMVDPNTDFQKYCMENVRLIFVFCVVQQKTMSRCLTFDVVVTAKPGIRGIL